MKLRCKKTTSIKYGHVTYEEKALGENDTIEFPMDDFEVVDFDELKIDQKHQINEAIYRDKLQCHFCKRPAPNWPGGCLVMCDDCSDKPDTPKRIEKLDWAFEVNDYTNADFVMIINKLTDAINRLEEK